MGPEKGRNFGMPIQEFINQVYEGLIQGNDQIIIGELGPPGTVNLRGIAHERRQGMENFSKLIRGGIGVASAGSK